MVKEFFQDVKVKINNKIYADINVELLPEGFSLDDGETLDRPVVSLW